MFNKAGLRNLERSRSKTFNRTMNHQDLPNFLETEVGVIAPPLGGDSCSVTHLGWIQTRMWHGAPPLLIPSVEETHSSHTRRYRTHSFLCLLLLQLCIFLEILLCFIMLCVLGSGSCGQHVFFMFFVWRSLFVCYWVLNWKRFYREKDFGLQEYEKCLN